MANIRGSVSDDLQEYIPNVCTNSPANGLAFCKQHSEIISSLGYPTGLREFLKSCASSDGEQINPDNYTKNMQQKVDSVLTKICNEIPASTVFKSCTDAQGAPHLTFHRNCSFAIAGTGYLLRDRKILSKDAVDWTRR